jgi:hypothetical protein
MHNPEVPAAAFVTGEIWSAGVILGDDIVECNTEVGAGY